jgi:23S rRNA pseudouridine1911/1915/1917 synthase
LETGRKHQIRLQLSHHGWPIVGDRKYGSQRKMQEGIALHAIHLRITHPVRKTELTITAPVPNAWRQLGVRPDEIAGP